MVLPRLAQGQEGQVMAQETWQKWLKLPRGKWSAGMTRLVLCRPGSGSYADWAGLIAKLRAVAARLLDAATFIENWKLGERGLRDKGE
jgi:hypothetical protein